MIPIRISDLGRIITGATPPTKEPRLFGSEVSFLTPSDMTFDRRHVQTKRGVSSAGAARFGTRLLPPNAVAVVCIGATIGKVCMTDGPVLTNQQVNSIVVDESRHSPDFVYYLMRTMRNRLETVAGGAATPIVNKSSFALLEVTVPDRRTQFRIGAYLKSFDDLIEVNRRRLEVLEGMARLLYREWFVYFRYPGHEDTELVDSDLGPIPDGWEAGRLGSILELAYGKALRAGDRRGGPVGVYGSGGHVGWHDEALVTGPGIVVGRKGNVGSVYWSDGDFFPIDTTYYVKSDLPLRFLDQLLRTLKFIDSHAAVPGLSRDQAYGLIVPEPINDLLSRYETVVRPMYDLRRNLSNQTAVLREARDLLLPRLVSGELDVSDLGLGLVAV